MYFILKCSGFATKLYCNKIDIIFLIINRSMRTVMNNNDKPNNPSSNISSTKTKGSYHVKRKKNKNKRSSKRNNSFCIIV